MEEFIPDKVLNKEIAQTDREVRTNLSKVKRPPRERKRLFHPDSLYFIVCNIESQNANRRGSPLIERPNHDSDILTPTNIAFMKICLQTRHLLKQ